MKHDRYFLSNSVSKNFIQSDAANTKEITGAIGSRNRLSKNVAVNNVEIVDEFRCAGVDLTQNAEAVQYMKRRIPEEMSREGITGESGTVEKKNLVPFSAQHCRKNRACNTGAYHDDVEITIHENTDDRRGSNQGPPVSHRCFSLFLVHRQETKL